MPKNTFSSFSTFLNSHGILHQSTCPHTLQQIYIIGKKNN